MNEKRFRIAIILSLLLHFVLVAIIWIGPEFLVGKKPDEKLAVEIVDADDVLKQLEQLKEQDKVQGQIVTQDEKALNNEIDKNARFLSKNNQRVEQQTRAELNDRFKNSTGAGGPTKAEVKPGETEKPAEGKSLADQDKKSKVKPPTSESVAEESENKAEKTEKEFITENGGVPHPLTLSDLKPSFRPKPKPLGSQASGGGDGPSATDDHLKDVKTGMQTMLSTREFVYYSYYNRIKDRLRQYWEPKIKEKMERIMRQGRKIASDNDKITRLVIVLDAQGTLVRVQVVGASGVTDLDDAAIEAFRAAAPFPNPPNGIVEKDGLIRIRWDFILEASTNSIWKAGRYAQLD